MYGLREKDYKIVCDVLADLRSSIMCEIGIGGSLAQRALSTHIAHSLAGRPLHDIDLVLIGIGELSPTLPNLHEAFHVMEKVKNGSWYFGLTHRKTGMWVDLFSPAPGQTFVPVQFGNITYQAATIESQILYLAQNILWRIKTRQPIRRKWQRKLQKLMCLPTNNTKAIVENFNAHKEYYCSVLPSKTPTPTNWHTYCVIALAQKPTPIWEDVWKGICWYFWKRKRNMVTETKPQSVV